MDISKIREDLILKEGIRYKAYADPILGEIAMTTGVGHLIVLPQEEELLEKELTMDEVMEILDGDIEVALKDARRFIDEDSIQIKMFDEDDWIGIEAEYIDVNGQTKKVFDISLGWTWSEEEINA
jgi:hypothetical protein